jgi:hypothetical protein
VTGPDSAAAGAFPPGSADAEPVGSVAEEAFKLFRAVTTSSAVPGDDPTHVCAEAWCPACRVVGLVRDHPEAIASVTHSAAQLARSLRDLVDTALAPQEKQ